MIQAVIHRLLESIRGLNKSRLDWGLYFKCMERHQHRPRQQLPLILQCSATNGDAPFQIFIWCQTWKSRDGALYVVSWSCRRAVTSRTTAKQNILQLYNPSELRPRTLLLPFPRWFTQPDTHWPLYYLSTRQLLEGCFFFFFLTNPKKLFPQRWHKLVFGWDENLSFVKHIQGLFPGSLSSALKRKLLHTFIFFNTSIFKPFLVCFWLKAFLQKTHTFILLPRKILRWQLGPCSRAKHKASQWKQATWTGCWLIFFT